jgi:integrase
LAHLGDLPGSASQAFRRLVEQSGMRPVRFHDLRHTSAVLGIASGESLYEVFDRLGLSGIVVTEQRHAHLLDDARGQGAAKRSAVL